MENNELEEMRTQLKVLNKKLDKESIVDEKTMKSKTHILDMFKWGDMIGNVIMLIPILVFWYRHPHAIITTLLAGGFGAYALVNILATLLNYRNLHLKDILNNDLSMAVTQLKNFKKSKKKWFFIGCGVMALFSAVFCIIIALKLPEPSILPLIAVTVGGILLIILIDYLSNRMTFSICDDIIKQLEEQ